MTRDESIASITDATRNESQEHHPGPPRAEASEDLQDGVRFGVDRVIHDQNHAGQCGGASHALFDDRVTSGRLLGREAKYPGRIAADHESDPSVAQVTDSIEQN